MTWFPETKVLIKVTISLTKAKEQVRVRKVITGLLYFAQHIHFAVGLYTLRNHSSFIFFITHPIDKCDVIYGNIPFKAFPNSCCQNNLEQNAKTIFNTSGEGSEPNLVPSAFSLPEKGGEALGTWLFFACTMLLSSRAD